MNSDLDLEQVLSDLNMWLCMPQKHLRKSGQGGKSVSDRKRIRILKRAVNVTFKCAPMGKGKLIRRALKSAVERGKVANVYFHKPALRRLCTAFARHELIENYDSMLKKLRNIGYPPSLYQLIRRRADEAVVAQHPWLADISGSGIARVQS